MAGTKRTKPITIVYDWLYNEPFGCERRSYTAKTPEAFERAMKIIRDNPEKYKVVSVTK